MANQRELEDACKDRENWVADFIRLVESSEWGAPKVSNGVTLQTQLREGESLFVLKATQTVQATPQELLAFFKDFDRTFPICDTMVKEFKVYLTLDDVTRLQWASFRVPFPLSTREFLWAAVDRMISDDTGVSMGKSVELSAFPPRKGLVRGRLLTSGYYFKANGPATSELAYIVQVDPAGFIPVFVSNLIISDQAANVGRIAAYFATQRK